MYCSIEPKPNTKHNGDGIFLIIIYQFPCLLLFTASHMINNIHTDTDISFKFEEKREEHKIISLFWKYLAIIIRFTYQQFLQMVLLLLLNGKLMLIIIILILVHSYQFQDTNG